MSNEEKTVEVPSSPQPDASAPLRTMTAFNGADMIVVINGQPVGEVQEIRYTEDILPFRKADKTLPVQGHIKVVVFDKSPLRDLLTGDDEVWLLFGNEYGSKMVIRLEAFKCVKREGKFGIDNVLFYETFFFEATKVVYDRRTWEYHGVDGVGVEYRLIDKEVASANE